MENTRCHAILRVKERRFLFLKKKRNKGIDVMIDLFRNHISPFIFMYRVTAKYARSLNFLIIIIQIK